VNGRHQLTGPSARGRGGTPDVRTSAATELAQLAMLLRKDRQRWQHLVRFDPTHRWYDRFTTGPGWEAWLLTWLPGQSTGLHDHGVSAGAFTVLTGALTETVVPSGVPQTRTLIEGEAHGFSEGYVHDVGNQGHGPAVGLHVYSPALATMTRYLLEADGRLTPTSFEKAEADCRSPTTTCT
jgi:predicted metal-dependent enzyme (double-stranded beta helix superfamily)